MFTRRILALSSLGLLVLQASCGDKNVTENVNMDTVEWVGKHEDNIGVLHRGSALKIAGDIQGNKPYVVSFSLADARDQPIDAKSKGLEIVYKRPPSGKTSLSLQDDLSAGIQATDRVCNGEYILNVHAENGPAKVKKPLRFVVRDGSDGPECKTKPRVVVETKTGRIENVQGKKNQLGSFNLETGESVSSKTGSGRDLIDLTLVGKAFSHKLGSMNHAEFVHYGNRQINTLTFAEAQAAFRSSVPQKTTDILYAGNVILIYLPRTNSLYALRVLNVEQGTFRTGHKVNDGFIGFEYRRLTPDNNT
jgi:nitrogen fixation protein FixH